MSVRITKERMKKAVNTIIHKALVDRKRIRDAGYKPSKFDKNQCEDIVEGIYFGERNQWVTYGISQAQMDKIFKETIKEIKFRQAMMARK